jgi:hypothetical protein
MIQVISDLAAPEGLLQQEGFFPEGASRSLTTTMEGREVRTATDSER